MELLSERALPYIWVIFLPLIGSVLVLALGQIREKIVPHVAFAVGAVNAVFGVLLLIYMRPGVSFSYNWLPGISNFTVVADGLGSFISATAAILGALILMYSLRYMEHEEGKTRYYALVLLFIGAMSGLVLSGSLLTMYFFWETVGICSFSLIGFHYEDPKALKGAIKAFITTRIGDVGLLLGILTLYFAAKPHSFDIGIIAANASRIPPKALTFAAFSMLLGAIGKSAQVPLHVWLPDAMEAPTSVSALIHAATMVNAGVYLVARMYPVFSLVPFWTQAVTWVGTITLFMAALMAIAAKDIKRMLAHSTVSQLGYMFFAVGTGGILASQFHLVSHAIFKALLFLSAGALIHEAHTRDMDLLSGAGKKMPITGLGYLLGVMGLSGIPLFSGFFSKDMILAHALGERLYVPLLLAVLGAVMTFIYSWRSYFKVWRNEPSKALAHAHDAPRAMTLPLIALGLGTFTSWLLVGRQSAGLSEIGVEGIHHVGAFELLKETFTNPALGMSLLAIALGGFTVYRYEAFMSWLQKHLGRLHDLAFNGFYFDEFYLRVLGFLGALGRSFAHGIDGGIEFFGKALSLTVEHLIRFLETLDGKVVVSLGRGLWNLLRWGSEKAQDVDYKVLEGSGVQVFHAMEKSGRVIEGQEKSDLNGNLIRILVGISIITLIVIVETGV